MISTLRWVRKITFHFFFWICSQILDSILRFSRREIYLGCSSATTFFCGVSAQHVFSTCFRSRGAWDPTRTRNVHKTVLRREKGISPPKCGFSQNQKDKKKHNHHQHLNNGSGQSRIETGARTNSTPTPAPTDDRQLAVRYRYRDGLEVPHIVRLREPLDLALIRNAAALEQNPAG